MRVTQGTFSFLPELTDEQIARQIDYCLGNGWAVSVEYTDDPHPRNTYWEMFGKLMFDIRDAAGVMTEVNACRKTFPNHYIKALLGHVRFHARAGVIAAVVHRRPACRRAGIRSGARGGTGPQRALYDARLCDAAPGGRALLSADHERESRTYAVPGWTECRADRR